MTKHATITQAEYSRALQAAKQKGLPIKGVKFEKCSDGTNALTLDIGEPKDDAQATENEIDRMIDQVPYETKT